MDVPTRSRRVAAFTLIELLVVVAIIALLISILLPSLNRARQQARKVVCATNMRSLSQAAFTYAMEYGVFPTTLSNWSPNYNTFQPGLDWLGIGDFRLGSGFDAGVPDDPNTGNPVGWSEAPTLGVLYPYVKNPDVYLCASDNLVEPGTGDDVTPVPPEGGPGNGKFSYSMMAMMGMRQPERIPAREADTRSGGSRGGGGSFQKMGKVLPDNTPLFIEEHPLGINGRSIDGNFNFFDRIVMRHPGYSVREAKVEGNERTLRQGTTQIGFADGHVGDLAVNWGYTIGDVRNDSERDLVPMDAEGLLWYFGIEFNEASVIPIPAP